MKEYSKIGMSAGQERKLREFYPKIMASVDEAFKLLLEKENASVRLRFTYSELCPIKTNKQDKIETGTAMYKQLRDKLGDFFEVKQVLSMNDILTGQVKDFKIKISLKK
jgi:hypothetical protein